MNDELHLRVKMVNDDVNCLPRYSNFGDAGADIRSTIDIVIEPLSKAIVPCGFCVAIPCGYAGLVLPRSGLAANHGITVLNSPGLIDSGYRGEIKAVLYNADPSNSFKVNAGDRIAQFMIIKVPEVLFEPVTELEESTRGSKGFGSTGVK